MHLRPLTVCVLSFACVVACSAEVDLRIRPPDGGVVRHGPGPMTVTVRIENPTEAESRLSADYVLRDLLSGQTIEEESVIFAAALEPGASRESPLSLDPAHAGYYLLEVRVRESDQAEAKSARLPVCFTGPALTYLRPGLETSPKAPMSGLILGASWDGLGFPRPSGAAGPASAWTLEAQNAWAAELYDFIGLEDARMADRFPGALAPGRCRLLPSRHAAYDPAADFGADSRAYLQYHDGTRAADLGLRYHDWTSRITQRVAVEQAAERLARWRELTPHLVRLPQGLVAEAATNWSYFGHAPQERERDLWAPYGTMALERWREWLEQTYQGDRTRMNLEFERRYGAFNAVKLPQPLDADTRLKRGPRVVWRRFIDFRYDVSSDFLRTVVEATRRELPGAAVAVRPPGAAVPPGYLSDRVGQRLSDYLAAADVLSVSAPLSDAGLDSARAAALDLAARLATVRPAGKPLLVHCDLGTGARRPGESLLAYTAFGAGADVVSCRLAPPADDADLEADLAAQLRLRRRLACLRYTVGRLDPPTREVAIYVSPRSDHDRRGGEDVHPGTTARRLAAALAELHLPADIVTEYEAAVPYRLVFVIDPHYDQEAFAGFARLADGTRTVVLDNVGEAFTSNVFLEQFAPPNDLPALTGSDGWQSAVAQGLQMAAAFPQRGALSWKPFPVAGPDWRRPTHVLRPRAPALSILTTADGRPVGTYHQLTRVFTCGFRWADLLAECRAPEQRAGVRAFLTELCRELEIRAPVETRGLKRTTAPQVLTWLREGPGGAVVFVANFGPPERVQMILANDKLGHVTPAQKYWVIADPFQVSARVLDDLAVGVGNLAMFDLELEEGATRLLVIPYRPLPVGLPRWATCYWQERDRSLHIVPTRSGDFTQRFIAPVGFLPQTAQVGGRPLEFEGPGDGVYSVAGTVSARRGQTEEIVITFRPPG